MQPMRGFNRCPPVRLWLDFGFHHLGDDTADGGAVDGEEVWNPRDAWRKWQTKMGVKKVVFVLMHWYP